MALWHRYGWIAYLAVFVGVLGHASAEFFSVLSGILISYIFDITPAGTIVLFSIGLLGATIGIKSLGLLSKK